MSGVYIKGIKMPKDCRSCRFSGFGGIRNELNVCMFTGQSQPTLSPECMSECPLIPIPDHGRLIDADAFFEDLLFPTKEFERGMQELIADAPTIIPADKEGEE